MNFVNSKIYALPPNVFTGDTAPIFNVGNVELIAEYARITASPFGSVITKSFTDSTFAPPSRATLAKDFFSATAFASAFASVFARSLNKRDFSDAI